MPRRGQPASPRQPWARTACPGEAAASPEARQQLQGPWGRWPGKRARGQQEARRPSVPPRWPP
eukprot:7619607-Lingulodinium_polyedra.AAC.1